MRLSELPRPIQWLLCAYEMFRRLEFKPEDLFFGCDGTAIYIQLQHHGETFTWADSAEGLSQETFLSIWPDASDAWNNADDEEAISLFEGSRIKDKSEDLIKALLKKEIIPPLIVN